MIYLFVGQKQIFFKLDKREHHVACSLSDSIFPTACVKYFFKFKKHVDMYIVKGLSPGLSQILIKK